MSSLICCVFWTPSLSRIIKNKEALSEIMQDFKYDSEESDWQVAPTRPAAALSHHQTAALTDQLHSAATSILDSSGCTYWSPCGPTLLAAAVLFHPGGFSHCGSVCFYLQACVWVNVCISKKNKQTRNHLYFLLFFYAVKTCVNNFLEAHQAIFVYSMNRIF